MLAYVGRRSNLFRIFPTAETSRNDPKGRDLSVAGLPKIRPTYGLWPTNTTYST